MKASLVIETGDEPIVTDFHLTGDEEVTIVLTATEAKIHTPTEPKVTVV